MISSATACATGVRRLSAACALPCASLSTNGRAAIRGPPPSLHCEGWAMLRAVLTDFARSPKVQAVTLVHERFERLPPGEVHRVDSPAAEEARFRALASSADATLVIAPETGWILDTRCRWVEESGGWLLGPSEGARQLSSSKHLLGEHWRAAGVPTPPVLAYGAGIRTLNEFPVVIKPDDRRGLASDLRREQRRTIGGRAERCQQPCVGDKFDCPALRARHGGERGHPSGAAGGP